MFTCLKCHKIFKFNYLLQRHNNRKKSCILIDIDNFIDNNIDDNINKNNNINNNNDNNDDTNLKLSDDNNVDNINKNKKVINLESQIINKEKKINKINDKLQFNLDKSIKNKKCYYCKKEYNKNYNLLRHIKDFCEDAKKLNNKKNKLNEEKNKLIEQKEDRDKNIQINELRNMVAKLLKKKSTNINITNKITNNNLMVNINSFGNESLSHITINDYKRFLSGLFPGFINFIEKVHFDENAPENHNICITLNTLC